MLALLLAQVSPPIINVPRSTPAVISPMPLSSRDRAPWVRLRVRIIVRAGDEVLWNGAMWISPQAVSSYRQSLAEASPDDCAEPSAYVGRGEQELSLQFSPVSRGISVTPALTLEVRWSRPAELKCGGMRTVQLRQNVPLDFARPQMFRADGGLTIEISRP